MWSRFQPMYGWWNSEYFCRYYKTLICCSSNYIVKFPDLISCLSNSFIGSHLLASLDIRYLGSHKVKPLSKDNHEIPFPIINTYTLEKHGEPIKARDERIKGWDRVPFLSFPICSNTLRYSAVEGIYGDFQ